MDEDSGRGRNGCMQGIEQSGGELGQRLLRGEVEDGEDDLTEAGSRCTAAGNWKRSVPEERPNETGQLRAFSYFSTARMAKSTNPFPTDPPYPPGAFTSSLII
jgi:hypothetical protein